MNHKEKIELRYKNRVKKIRELLKFMIDNPEHNVQLLQMWSPHKAQIVCKDTCYEEYMDFDIAEDGQIPHAYLNYSDVLKALNLKEYKND